MLVVGESNPEMHKPPRDPEDGPCGVLQVLDLTNRRRYAKEAETTAGEALLICSQASQISDGVRSQRPSLADFGQYICLAVSNGNGINSFSLPLGNIAHRSQSYSCIYSSK